MKNALFSPLPPNSPANPPHPLDEALGCCQHIQVLALLLQRAGNPPSGVIGPLAISNAGFLIELELENLRQLLSRIQELRPGITVAPTGNGHIQPCGE